MPVNAIKLTKKQKRAVKKKERKRRAGPEERTEGPAFQGKFLNFIKDKVTIRTITPNEEFRGDILPSMTYKALVGDDPLNQRIFESYQNYRSGVMDYNELSERAFLNVRAELEGYDP